MTTPGDSTARRRAEISPLRRLSRNVLIVGTVVAVLAAFGPVWVVRFGVLVAVAAAVIGCVVAWRELAEARRAHSSEMLSASKAHGSALTEERRQNATVVDTLTGRIRQTRAEIERHRQTILELTGTVTALEGTVGTLRGDVSTLRAGRAADQATAQREIRQREQAIAALRETVRSREAELLALSEAAGQVRAIPRRVLAEHQSASSRAPDADDLLADGSHPTVASLVDVPVVLPNYEGERRFA